MRNPVDDNALKTFVPAIRSNRIYLGYLMAACLEEIKRLDGAEDPYIESARKMGYTEEEITELSGSTVIWAHVVPGAKKATGLFGRHVILR